MKFAQFFFFFAPIRLKIKKVTHYIFIKNLCIDGHFIKKKKEGNEDEHRNPI